MRDTKKYSNIKEELPKLPEVLLNTIQSDVLEIRKIDKTCEKFLKASLKIAELKNAHYVVYSKYIDKENHRYEKFIFLDKDGEELFNLSGLEIELYGLLACTNLSYTDEYKALTSQ
ncbi:MAG: hypothetical protein OEL19_02130 [Sulfurimonas sp.]|nr:hypothetical protein [Sulfurimonas sp.]